MALRKAFGHNGACAYHGIRPERDAWKGHGIHGDPAVFAEDNGLAGLIAVDIGKVVICRDQSDAWRDHGSFTDGHRCADTLKVVSGGMKVTHIIGIKDNILGNSDTDMGRAGPRHMAVLPHDLLPKPVSQDPVPAICVMPAVKVLTGQIFFIVLKAAP